MKFTFDGVLYTEETPLSKLNMVIKPLVDIYTKGLYDSYNGINEEYDLCFHSCRLDSHDSKSVEYIVCELLEYPSNLSEKELNFLSRFKL